MGDNRGILTREEYLKLAKEFTLGLYTDMVAQYDKGYNKRGEVDLFNDPRDFGSIPRGSEPYMEFVDICNYGGVFGPERARRIKEIL